MSLKSFFTLAVALLGTLAVSATASLIILTTLLHRASDQLWSAVEGVRLVEELEVDLLTHYRLAHPALAAGSQQQRDPRAVEQSLRRHLAAAGQLVDSEPERRLLARVEEPVEGYLSTFQQADGLSPEDMALEVVPRLEAALAPLEELIGYELAGARQIQAQAARWDTLANVLGLGVAVLLVLGGLVLLVGLRRYVLRPLLELNTAMRRFGSGRKRARATESGPAELREMARTFNDMAASLVRQQEEQLAFLAGVAHELRNPLSALKMSTALAPAGRPVSEERLQRTLSLVRRQVTRLERMVGDLLDATHIESGRFELRLEPRDVSELAREVVELYQSGPTGQELHLQLPEEPLVLPCDPARLEQVLNNLVSNALKYSPSGSRVDVWVQHEGAEAVLSVVDRGIGIAPEELRHLFAPFRRARGARERAPGVGLGLSVARRIVEAHGGHLEVESGLGQGSTFRVHLPLGPRATSAPQASASEPVQEAHTSA
jgi:two-component system, OmpR family, sensor histidine kinase MtrB